MYFIKPRNRQIAQQGMNMGQDRQMQMVGANGGNQFRQYAGQNVGNQVVQNTVQNQAARAEGNSDWINQRNPTQAEEFDLMAAAARSDEIEEVMKMAFDG
ncbi:hypothetical protein Tco_0456210 [Tanacetum coccineum]